MRELSIDSLKTKLRRYPHLDEPERFIKKIEKSGDLKILVLFGSLTKGTYTQYSDIDVLCVFDKRFDTPREKFLEAYKYSDGRVEPKTLTLAEFKKGLIEGNLFLHKIMKEGIIILRRIPARDIEKWIEIGKKSEAMNKMRLIELN